MTAVRLAGALLLGVAVGVASVLHHRSGWLPLGLALAVPAALAGLLSRGSLRAGFGLGWAAVVLLGVLGTDEGDVLVAADGRGWLLLLESLVLLAVAFATIPVRGGRST